MKYSKEVRLTKRTRKQVAQKINQILGNGIFSIDAEPAGFNPTPNKHSWQYKEAWKEALCEPFDDTSVHNPSILLAIRRTQGDRNILMLDKGDRLFFTEKTVRIIRAHEEVLDGQLPLKHVYRIRPLCGENHTKKAKALYKKSEKIRIQKNIESAHAYDL